MPAVEELRSLSYWDLRKQYPDKYKVGMKKYELIEQIMDETINEVVSGKEIDDNVPCGAMSHRDWSAYEKYWELKSGNTEDAIAKVGANSDYHEAKQYKFLTRVGLKPEHRFLDIGVGCLRGTMRIVNYLNEGNFYGMDISQTLLEKGKERYLDYRRTFGWEAKKPTLIKINDFDFQEELGKFDFIFSNSLVTHLYQKDVENLFLGVSRILKDDGIFYFTMYPGLQCEGGIHLMLQPKDWIISVGRKNGLLIEDIEGRFENDHPIRKVIDIVNTELPQWVMKARLP